jgi:monoamine oxidase
MKPPHRSPTSTLSRRQFLRLAALGAAACALPAGAQRANAARAISGRVLVLGAGISGLAAARTLVDRYGGSAPGQVVVLEGRDRIGGRIATDTTLGTPVDMGAVWIHGTRRNPIASLAAEAGIATDETDYESLRLFDTDGAEVAGADYARLEADVYTSALRQARSWANARDNDPSLAQALAAVNADAGLSAAERRVLDWLWFWNIELDLTAELSQLSGWWWDGDRALKGPDVLFPSGYRQVVDHVAAGLDIRTGHTIEAVDTSGEGVVVTTDQGVFEADRCICTLPLGVLQAGAVEFTPALATGVQDAIDALGFGRAFKMALRFPSMFWDAGAHYYGTIAAPPAQCLEFLNVGRYTGAPILLMEANQGFAANLEAMNEVDAVARVMQDVRRIFGPSAPDPVSVVRSAWGSDPFTRGSYSYYAPGSSPRDRKPFARGIDRKLFFAGEHTSKKYPATVHGAWLSGLSAARQARRGL